VTNLKVKDITTLGPVWQRGVTIVGILVTENTKRGFTKLIKEFDKNPFFIRSSYSD
jgi:hypothetical protein